MSLAKLRAQVEQAVALSDVHLGDSAPALVQLSVDLLAECERVEKATKEATLRFLEKRAAAHDGHAAQYHQACVYDLVEIHQAKARECRTLFSLIELDLHLKD
jgi:hypothetical protein